MSWPEQLNVKLVKVSGITCLSAWQKLSMGAVRGNVVGIQNPPSTALNTFRARIMQVMGVPFVIRVCCVWSLGFGTYSSERVAVQKLPLWQQLPQIADSGCPAMTGSSAGKVNRVADVAVQ